MVRPSTASSNRQNPTAEIAAPSAYNAVLNGPVVPQIAPAPRPQAYPMIRVRCEDFGSCVFISQFYRRQQFTGSFSYQKPKRNCCVRMVIVCLRCDELQLTRL